MRSRTIQQSLPANATHVVRYGTCNLPLCHGLPWAKTNGQQGITKKRRNMKIRMHCPDMENEVKEASRKQGDAEQHAARRYMLYRILFAGSPEASFYWSDVAQLLDKESPQRSTQRAHMGMQASSLLQGRRQPHQRTPSREFSRTSGPFEG